MKEIVMLKEKRNKREVILGNNLVGFCPLVPGRQSLNPGNFLSDSSIFLTVPPR